LYFSLFSPSETSHNTLGRIGRRRAEAPHNLFEGGDGMAKRRKKKRKGKRGKAAFGGYSINFKGCTDSVEKVFGSSPIGPSMMTKKIWAYVKRKRLAKR
jgi:hypothetical protein